MKLITHNIEGMNRLPLIEEFLREENADVICLQEVPEAWLTTLNKMGYHTSFLFRGTRSEQTETFRDGAAIATKVPHQATQQYYYQTKREPDDSFDPRTDSRRNNHQGALHAQCNIKDQSFDIVTTHFTWAPDGKFASPAQTQDLAKLLAFTNTLPPHLLCGDFNIPRQHNALYKVLTTHYTDNIPAMYGSSLDKQFHRMKDDPSRAHLFTDFMIDYVFSQPPYRVSDVRLAFNLSDHAAVICTVEKIEH